MPDWNPYGAAPFTDDGGHMPLPFGVKGATAPWLEMELLVTPELGLMPSAELLLGGVSKLPTLVKVVVGVGCVVAFV